MRNDRLPLLFVRIRDNPTTAELSTASTHPYSFSFASHSPTTSGTQATLTTNSNMEILSANSTLCQSIRIAGDELKGMLVTSILAEKHRLFYSQLFADRRSIHNSIDHVLLCGNVIRLVRKDSSTFPVSLWLNEKLNSSQERIYIWLFELIDEQKALFMLDSTGKILESTGDGIFGVKPSELLHNTFGMLVPHLKYSNDRLDFASMHESRFFGGVTRRGKTMPLATSVMASDTESIEQLESLCLEHKSQKVKVVSLPFIAGVLTILPNGSIYSINNAFSKALFGIRSDDLVGKADIVELVPDFWSVFDASTLDNPFILERRQSRLNRTSAISSLSSETPVHDPMALGAISKSFLNDAELVTATRITAKHRDGTQLVVDASVRPIKVDGGNPLLAVWITFAKDDEAPRSVRTRSPYTAKSNESTNDDEVGALKDLDIKASFRLPLSIDDFEVTDTLGQGNYGFVRSACLLKDASKSSMLVIKHIVKSHVLSWCRREELGGLIPVEIAILNDLRRSRHPNITQAIGFFEDEFYVYLVMKNKGQMDLFEFTESRNGPPDEAVIRYIFKQIVAAVCHLHSLNIVHRDIKDENIIIDQTHRVTLIDFGSSAYIEEGKSFSTFHGTMDFAPPEVLEGRIYNGKPQEIWSLGILLYTMIYRQTPFFSVDEILSQAQAPFPFKLSDSSVDLLQSMLSKNAESRPTIESVLQHPWLSSNVL